MVGKSTNDADNEKVSAESLEYKDLILLKAKDSYETLTEKLLEYLEQISPQKFDFFMHCDDDSFVRLDLLIKELSNFQKTRLCWG